jgi:predicted PurR-regulated permease PerM
MEDLTRQTWMRRLIVAALLVGLLLLAFTVLQPFIVPVIWAVILAYVTWPAHERLVRLFRGQRGPAALVMTILLATLIIAPIVWLVVLVQTEVVHAYREITTLLSRGIRLPDFILDLPLVGDWLRDWLARISANPDELLTEIRAFLDRSSGEFGGFVGGVGRNVVKMVMAVVYGLLLAALAQGTLAGVGYWFAGLDAPVFLAALTFLVALIPFVVPFMWGGASLWLLVNGETGAALGLFVWGVTAVSWIDNIVRPLVISGATQIPFLMVMFGVLGGLTAFGLVGLFIGPVILAVLVAVWREWLAERAEDQVAA